METIRELRVAFLASTLVTGGAERVVESLARGLPGRGIETRVFCLLDRGEIGDAIAAAGVKVRSNIARLRRDPLAAWRLAEVLRQWRADVVVVLDHHNAIAAAAVARGRAEAPRLALMVHSTGLWGGRRTFSWTDRLALRSYDRIVALARSHERYLVDREGVDGARIAIIANGVDAERFRPAPSAEARSLVRGALNLRERDFVVAMVAALRPEKNHALFIRAAKRVRSEAGGCAFLVVGEGSEENNLRALAAGMRLEGVVRFLGRREDVPDVLAACDALVLASHPVVETFPLVVLEGMSAGLPVVASDVGSVREMMVDGEEGFIIPSGDEDALVERLLLIARRPEERMRIGTRARSRVKKEFTIDRMLGGYADMLKSLVA